MDKIVWQLGADSSQVQTEMAKAMRSGQQGAAALAGSFGRAEESHERLLRSSHRVARQIQSVTRDFAAGASAGDIFATSLEGIGRSLNIGLGALAGLAVGGILVGKIAKVREEYEKLQKALKDTHDAANQSGDFKTLAVIEAQAKSAEKAVEDLNKAIDSRAGKKGLGAQLGQFFSDAGNNLLSALPGGTGMFAAIQSAKDKADRKSQYGDMDTLEAQEVAKRRQQTGLKQASLNGAPDYEIKAAQALITAQENAAKSLDMAAESFRALSVELQQLVKVRNDKAMERAGRSLEETANSLPDVVNNSVSFEQYQASQQAKNALRLRGQGEESRLAGDTEGAHNLFNQAGEAAESITGLKPSEKMSADFKGALAVTEAQLTQIAKNTAQQFVNK